MVNTERVSERRDRLSREKQALLAKRLQGKTKGVSETKIMNWRQEKRKAPLSFAQQRLWFLDQLIPGSPLYNIPIAIPLKVPLKVAVLERCVNEIVRRHEVLRTSFSVIDDEPFQIIAPTLSLPLPVVDLQGLPKAEQEKKVSQLANEEAQRLFSLKSGTLLHTTLLRLDRQEYVFLLTIHHIISDGWSMNIFWQELAKLYSAFSLGQSSPLQELPMQYADFAVWQRQWLTGEVLEDQLAYWKKRLADITLLQLTTDFPRPAILTYQGAYQDMVFSRDLTAKLKRLSQQEKATLFMTLLAAFKVMLHRYTNQDDIVIGSPIANRNRVELEGLIGFFVNTLVLRTDLAGNPTFRELIGRVREVALGAYAHQDLPFEKLVEELQPTRDLSRNPLFQIMFQLVNTPGVNQNQNPSDTGMSPITANIDMAKFDLTLSISETDEQLYGALEYNTALFKDDTIARMLIQYRTLIEGIVAHSEQRLSDLPLLAADERKQLLVEWNDTQTDYFTDACIHELFEAQVERTPDGIAVVFEDEQLTYRELNRRANQVANHLQTLGVGADALVGICMERSLEMVIGLLGILKAGGAYVPLDPEYPKERLTFMLTDSGVNVLLTLKPLVEVFPDYEARVVCLDSDWDRIAIEYEKKVNSQVTADNLAYVIYTSGSTGRPKGVMVPHSAICNHMHWMQETFPLTAADRVIQKTPFSFDASIWEFHAPLISGAQLIMAKPEGHKDSAYLIRAMAKYEVTTLQVVPSQLQLLLEGPGLQNCTHLRRVFCGGEILTHELTERFFSSSKANLYNLYGPTEASIDAIFWECDGRNVNRIVPIGRPITNITVYLLDENLQPVPIGVTGKLYIGGKGLARGYLNRPEQTAELFIPDPFSNDSGARLYSTGDLARYRNDGSLEFLGRIDQQVKLRGFRIELGEIETVLSEHGGVRDSAVIIREDIPGDRRLVGYVVGHEDATLSISVLRSFLRARLPEHMVPTTIVALDVLPRTPNGKIDRNTLPRPTELVTETDYVAPQTEIEKFVASIWQEVLDIERVSIHDNFFDLGGHSLLLVRVHGKLRDILKRELSIIDMFQYPTVSSLAKHLEEEPENVKTDLTHVFDRGTKQKQAIGRQKLFKKMRRY